MSSTLGVRAGYPTRREQLQSSPPIGFIHFLFLFPKLATSCFLSFRLSLPRNCWSRLFFFFSFLLLQVHIQHLIIISSAHATSPDALMVRDKRAHKNRKHDTTKSCTQRFFFSLSVKRTTERVATTAVPMWTCTTTWSSSFIRVVLLKGSAEQHARHNRSVGAWRMGPAMTSIRSSQSSNRNGKLALD